MASQRPDPVVLYDWIVEYWPNDRALKTLIFRVKAVDVMEARKAFRRAREGRIEKVWRLKNAQA